MKLSDYVIEYLEKYGIKDAFLLSGGGMMHLLDAVGRSSINCYFNLNEQATTICSDAYAQYTKELSLALLTTGPGATNGVTGLVSAFQDSTPMLVISGQVKTSNLAPDGVRAYGAQEVNIVDMVKNQTKYAVCVTDATTIKYHLEKAIYLATHGRKGPVWVDIPLDIQATQIDEATLVGFNPLELKETNIRDKGSDRNSATDNEVHGVKKIADALETAKQPVILYGRGVVDSGAEKLAIQLAHEYNIPALSTWRAKEIFLHEDDMYFDMPGSQAPRYSNFILCRADVILIVGSRMDWSLTAFDEENYCPKARKFIVDIDNYEIDKLSIDFEGTLHMDAKVFLQELVKELHPVNCEEWLNKCREWKGKYPIETIRPNVESDGVWGYDFTAALNRLSKEDDVYAVSPTGRVCLPMNIGIALKGKQRMVAPRGLGSMGYALPTAIGTCVASGMRRTICFEGDGSLNHNIQELQVMVTYNLPIKLFIYNNGGYASIFGMQNNHFNGRLTGCNQESGVTLPSVKKIAEAYGIPYVLMEDRNDLETVMGQVLADDKLMICEVMGDIRFEEIPCTKTRINKDGSLSSSSMEDLYPFLDENI